MSYSTEDHRTDMLFQPSTQPPKVKRDRTIINWTLTGLGVVLAIALTLVLTGCGQATSHVLKSPAVVNVVAKPKPVAVAQPETAAQVAASLNCHEFTDLGPSTIGGSIDSGSCYINDDKYAINTFASHAALVSWLQAAEQLGVVPKWETPTSVTYPSVD